MKKLLFVNNGLTSLALDDTNKGFGFNLNQLCFMMTEEGTDKCYHFDNINDVAASGVQPEAWGKLNANLLEVRKKSTGGCMIDGKE